MSCTWNTAFLNLQHSIYKIHAAQIMLETQVWHTRHSPAALTQIMTRQVSHRTQFEKYLTTQYFLDMEVQTMPNALLVYHIIDL